MIEFKFITPTLSVSLSLLALMSYAHAHTVTHNSEEKMIGMETYTKIMEQLSRLCECIHIHTTIATAFDSKIDIYNTEDCAPIIQLTIMSAYVGIDLCTNTVCEKK